MGVMTGTTSEVLNAVGRERLSQDEKWGEQDHSKETWLTILMEEVGEAAQATLHWRFGGHHAQGLRQELIQVAAVAVAMVEALDDGRAT